MGATESGRPRYRDGVVADASIRIEIDLEGVFSDTRPNRSPIQPVCHDDMTISATIPQLDSYCREVANRSKVAAREMAKLSTSVKNRWLLHSADSLVTNEAALLESNAMDLSNADQYGLTPSERERLKLTGERIAQIATGLREVAALADPVGEVIEGSRRPNGLEISKTRVPLGVLFFIYESRPNVTADAAAIAIKSGNAIILRGGKEAIHSSHTIADTLRASARACDLPLDALQMVATTDREAVGHFLKMSDRIDLVIPRGGEALIRRVVAEATMPVLKHYDGNCHVYVDKHADLDKALRIVENSKCQRMGVCNAMESLLVHRDIASVFLPRLHEQLVKYDVEYRGDESCARILSSTVPATEADWSREYLGPIMSVKIVDSLDEAIDHIEKYSSRHTESIVTNCIQTADRFVREVDSAAVMINASTRFNDGGQLGMGAEIGISTDKFHARGPCGLRELTSYKFIVRGDGHVRTS